MDYHVSKNGNDYFDGTAKKPFLTINRAAKVAMAGDTVTVHEGTYREWVKPAFSGTGDLNRIVYKAAEGEKVIIKGSEHITGWEQVEGTVWKVSLPDSFFGDFNPYTELVKGDWMVSPDNDTIHVGDVYLNGRSFYEAATLDEVKKAEIRKFGPIPEIESNPVAIVHPEDTVYRWYCENNNGITTIYANFQGADPNKEYVEINVRKCCFFPERSGINYITVTGFEMAQAACTWAPPTGAQYGLIGPNWSKGWIIENNIIHDAKCSAISLGKDATTGDNEFTVHRRKPGYTYQLEAVFRACNYGWSKETVGSHIVRNNTVYDCGQNGIVGHMGCINSKIYNNHIYNIATKKEFYGYEIAGIKFHAAIDVQIYRNRVHDCNLGIWLDWEAQGARASRNLLYKNNSDLLIEVSHGPCLFDNNIFASKSNIENLSQGSAFVHNIFSGTIKTAPVLDRATPYHLPHSSKLLGVAFIHGGDDRFYNNIFIGEVEDTGEYKVGTSIYSGKPASFEEYMEKVNGYACCHGIQIYYREQQPVYIHNNAYYGFAKCYDREDDRFESKIYSTLKITEESDGVFAEITVDEKMLSVPTKTVSTATLGAPRITEEFYETPDGLPIVINCDINGIKRSDRPTVGAIENLVAGKNKIKIF